MENDEIEMVVVFKVIVIEEMIEKVVKIMDEEVDHEEVIAIDSFG
jgi:hypothetical protein